MAAWRWSIAFLIATLVCPVPGAVAQQPSDRVARALDAVMDAADRSRLRSFVVAISVGDELVFESWPRALGSRPAQFGLLGNTASVNWLLLRQLRGRKNPDEFRTTEASVLTATREGVTARPTTFELDHLAAGFAHLASFRGAVAREVCASGSDLQPFLVAADDYQVRSGDSVLPATLLCRALERGSGRRWDELVADLLGPPERADLQALNAPRFLAECADASTSGVELRPARAVQSGIAQFDSLEIDRRQVGALLKHLRLVAPQPPGIGGPLRLGILNYVHAGFTRAVDARGGQASCLAVRNDGESAFLLCSLADAPAVQRLGDILAEALRSKPAGPDPDAWNSAIGLGGDGGRPPEPPAWSKLLYEGEFVLAGARSPIELRITGDELTMWVGAGREQPQIRSFRLAPNGLRITLDGAAAWLPDRYRLGFEREAVCNVSLVFEEPALVGGAVLLDDSDAFRAANCVPAAVRLVPRR